MVEEICPTCHQVINPKEAIIIDKHQSDIEYNNPLRLITRGDISVRLSDTPYRMFSYIRDRYPNPVSKEVVWAFMYSDRIDGGPQLRIIDVHICNIRRAISLIGLEIVTIWGFGYQLHYNK